MILKWLMSTNYCSDEMLSVDTTTSIYLIYMSPIRCPDLLLLPFLRPSELTPVRPSKQIVTGNFQKIGGSRRIHNLWAAIVARLPQKFHARSARASARHGSRKNSVVFLAAAFETELSHERIP